MLSKPKPIAHTTTPTKNSAPGSLVSNIATMTDSDTNQMATAWVRKMPERAARGIGVALEHRCVARVLALPAAAPRDVDGQAPGAHGDEQRDDEATGVVAVARRQRVRDPRDHHEAEAPRDVDHVVATEGAAEHPGGEDQHEHRGRGDADGGEEVAGGEVAHARGRRACARGSGRRPCAAPRTRGRRRRGRAARRGRPLRRRSRRPRPSGSRGWPTTPRRCARSARAAPARRAPRTRPPRAVRWSRPAGACACRGRCTPR